MKTKYKIIISIVFIMFLIFTIIPIEKVYKLKVIDAKATVTPVTHNNVNKPTKEEERENYITDLISRNSDSRYNYIIRLLERGGDINKAKELEAMLAAVDAGNVPYENYIDEINLDGKYDAVNDLLEQSGDVEAAKSLVIAIDNGKYKNGLGYKEYLSRINRNGKYD